MNTESKSRYKTTNWSEYNQALNYLAQNDFSQKAIDIRNLFIYLLV